VHRPDVLDSKLFLGKGLVAVLPGADELGHRVVVGTRDMDESRWKGEVGQTGKGSGDSKGLTTCSRFDGSQVELVHVLCEPAMTPSDAGAQSVGTTVRFDGLGAPWTLGMVSSVAHDGVGVGGKGERKDEEVLKMAPLYSPGGKQTRVVAANRRHWSLARRERRPDISASLKLVVLYLLDLRVMDVPHETPWHSLCGF
jgi:hypothetical protein